MTLVLAHPRRAAAGVLAILVAGCGGALASEPAPPASGAPRGPTVTATVAPALAGATASARRAAPRRDATVHTRAVDRYAAAARHQYTAETTGPTPKALARRVARDRTLLRLLRQGDTTAARAYVAQRFPGVWYHWHISRLRIAAGARVVDEIGVPFTVAPAEVTLRGTGGRALGTLQVSIQDEVGFVGLMHRRYPIDVVVRGRRGGHVRTSLPAAVQAPLPLRGTVTIAGVRYRVRSFSETAWANEPVTVWILARA